MLLLRGRRRHNPVDQPTALHRIDFPADSVRVQPLRNLVLDATINVTMHDRFGRQRQQNHPCRDEPNVRNQWPTPLHGVRVASITALPQSRFGASASISSTVPLRFANARSRPAPGGIRAMR